MIQQNYKSSLMLLYGLIVGNTGVLIEKIDASIFNEANFQDRKTMLKISFEKVLIALADALPKKTLAIDYENYKEQIKVISPVLKAVKEVCVGVQSNNYKNESVLFRCFKHADKNPSMSWSASQHGFYCFSCSGGNEVVDIFNLIQMLTNCNFKDSFKTAVGLFVDNSHLVIKPFADPKSTETGKHSDFIPFSKEMNKVRHYSFLYPIENDNACLAKLQSERGISAKTAKRFSVMTWYPTVEGIAGKINTGYGYWLFINDDGSYSRRLAVENKELTKTHTFESMKWWNPTGKEMGVFNTRVIEHCREHNQVCFITESAIDALSCEELGFHAVGLNSINNLMEFFVKYVNEETQTMFICMVDNDTEGRKRIKVFEKQGIYVPEFLKPNYEGKCFLKGFKDINEALVSNKINTKNELAYLENEAKKYYGSIE